MIHFTINDAGQLLPDPSGIGEVMADFLEGTASDVPAVDTILGLLEDGETELGFDDHELDVFLQDGVPTVRISNLFATERTQSLALKDLIRLLTEWRTILVDSRSNTS